ncbi:polysaccharide biosynthesis protein [Fictibacillus aquaticus]|uniref:Multidrug transporter MatE n=1 Tax=Fictibacillus aquaticus TaxID=2021314 RepID=A0A235FCF5_9BACL|nr:polysaccharide biosynthesis protein [Fictibacillus aquaticus]OYD58637.1 multidrug transporter MatE [Fictibacillus aquaticus]
MKLFYRGVFLLALASLAGESLEFITNMVLAKELGEHGLGHFMSILPTIFLIVIIASLELPISVSKYVAEREENEHYSMLKHALFLTVCCTAALLLLSLVVLPFLGVFNTYHPLVRWLVVLLIPVISFTSIARGYFMGKQQMGKIAFSNLARKIVQLILLTGVYQLFSFSQETAILVAIATLIGSEVVVFLYLFTHYVLQYNKMRKIPSQDISLKDVTVSLAAVSGPATALRLFHAVTNAFQPFLIKYALMSSGISAADATGQFGILAGVAMTVGFFPGFIAHALLVVLIPTVSEAYAKRDTHKLAALLRQAMFITFCYGVPSAFIAYYFSDPLTELFFHSSSAGEYVKLLWPAFLFTFFLVPLQAYLIGLGLIKAAFYQSVWATVLSFGIMFVLGSNSSLQMNGIIIGINAGSVLLMLLHYFSICRTIGISMFLTNSRFPSPFIK